MYIFPQLNVYYCFGAASLIKLYFEKKFEHHLVAKIVFSVNAQAGKKNCDFAGPLAVEICEGTIKHLFRQYVYPF